jgi:hypothetical protein
MNASSIAIGLCMALAACSSAYSPRASKRLTIVMQGGSVAYLRGGQVYEAGVFHGGLVDAVQGVPAAVDAAKIYRRRAISGTLLWLGGAVCIPIAAFATVDQISDGATGTAYAILGGCAAVSIVGALIASSGSPYYWDAINLYNDGVDPGAPAQGLLPSRELRDKATVPAAAAE